MGIWSAITKFFSKEKPAGPVFICDTRNVVYTFENVNIMRQEMFSYTGYVRHLTKSGKMEIYIDKNTFEGEQIRYAVEYETGFFGHSKSKYN